MIGLIAGVLVIESVFFVERRLKLDDPVGAISVHGVCGLFGVLSVGIFSDGSYGAGWNLTTDVEGGVTGILYGGSGAEQLLAQAIGCLTLVVVFGLLSYGFFKLQDVLTSGGIRSNPEDEIAGLDLPEMGVLAYTTMDTSSIVAD